MRVRQDRENECLESSVINRWDTSDTELVLVQ
jgi:hypothetical protein